MINKVLIVVCNEGELEKAFQAVNQLGNSSVKVIGISELKDEIELIEQPRQYVPIHFLQYEPRDGFNKEHLIHEEFELCHGIGMIGHDITSRLVGFDFPSKVIVSVPHGFPKLTVDELALLKAKETSELVISLREDMDYLLFEENDEHRPWKNTRHDLLPSSNYVQRGIRIKTRRFRCQRKTTPKGC